MVETGAVEYAEPNLITTMPDVQVNPTDFLYGQQWHLPLIGAPDAWAALQAIDPNLTFGHQDVIIAVLDRGIQSETVGGVTGASHPDFDGTVAGGADKVYRFYDFARMEPHNDLPPNDHGMGCAGVAGALAENPAVVSGETEGVAGIAPNCRLMGLIRPAGLPEIRYSDAYIWTAGFDPGWVPANYPAGTVFPAAISPGADIITNSFKGGAGAPISGLMRDTFDFLTTYGRGGRGVALFFASGNDNADYTLECPWAAYEKTIAVAASTDGETRTWYSNYGNGIDICAPSSGGTAGITTCDLLGGGNLAGHTGGGLDYRDNFGGTSSATPLAAGLGALILSVNRDFTWVEVRHILRDTAVRIDAANTDPVGQWVDTDGDGIPDYSQWYGHGRIDAHAAVNAAIAYPFNRDILVRDNLADTGAVPCAGAFWGSPDVWVRAVDPATDGAAALPATYNDPPPHVSPVFGQDNWVYVRCRNTGTADSLDFYIRVYLTHFPGFEFVYPDDFIPSNPPGQPVPTPLTPGTYLIGEVHHDPLAAGAVDVVHVTWPQALVPPEEVMVGGMPVKWHPCLLVEIAPHDGPAASGVHVWDDNNPIQRNISIVYPDTDDTFAVVGVVGSRANPAARLDLVIDRGNLPCEVKLYAEVINPRAKEELRRVAARRQPGVGESCCRVTLLDESRFLVDCPAVPGGGRMVVTLPANAKVELWPAGKPPAEGEYNFTLGSYRGREVAWLAETGKTRLPVAAGPGELTPVIVGGVAGKGARPGTYEIALSQVNPDGRVSGMMGIELRIRG